MSTFLKGVGIGAFFSLMNASFAYEDPLLRAQAEAGKTGAQKARDVFREMATNAWRSGRGFGKVGALFAGTECVIESVSPSSSPSFMCAQCFLIREVIVFSIVRKTTWSTRWSRVSLQAVSLRGTLGQKLRLRVEWRLRHFHLQSTSFFGGKPQSTFKSSMHIEKIH
jgi:hypothetical protein